MFVCNKWDTIEEAVDDDDGPETVWRKLNDKIKQHWPNVEQKQVHRISARRVSTIKQHSETNALLSLTTGAKIKVKFWSPIHGYTCMIEFNYIDNLNYHRFGH